MSGTMFEQARDKIDREWKSGKYDRYGSAMKDDVRDALTGFCQQDEEFAQAVVQGGSFEDCMKAVGKCVKGQSISDMEAFGAAVKFYFPGAGIRVTMEIDLLASVRGDEPEPKKEDSGLLIDLSDFFWGGERDGYQKQYDARGAGGMERMLSELPFQ